MEPSQVIGVLILISGFGLLAAGIAVYFRQRAAIARSRTAEGTVVDMLSVRRGNTYLVKRTPTGITLEPKRIHRPVVRFSPPEGGAYEIRASVASSPVPFRIGDAVTVRYDPADPAAAQIDRPLYLWFWVGMLVFFGFFSICMGLMAVVVF